MVSLSVMAKADTGCADERPNMAIPRSTIMIRLLDSCIRILASYGMRNLFIDAVKWGDQGFQELGTYFTILKKTRDSR